ncbi:hypothetical protein T12_1306 [Trichinella patagoniensis]|uniref:Uncharacterized protein n=1 Tax=Trichinella patagoniensis TaxID=990121 RepID=A0A0V0ZAV8_9BILA|nr:hypothetical protein T12_1306 [Trichinella patagoniensis]
MSTAPLESRLSIAETVSREMGALDAQVGETDTKPVRPSHIDIKESAAKATRGTCIGVVIILSNGA